MLATDATGAVASSIAFEPFGAVHATTGLDTGLRFPGQVYHWETSLHQNWMRDYDPSTGRYIQADPLGLVDGASVYGYALQSPARYSDPRGEQIIGGPGSGPRLACTLLGIGCSESVPETYYGENCDREEYDRYKLIYRKCTRQCADYFAEGPFPGHSGADQAAGIRKLYSRMHACTRLPLLGVKNEHTIHGKDY